MTMASGFFRRYFLSPFSKAYRQEADSLVQMDAQLLQQAGLKVPSMEKQQQQQQPATTRTAKAMGGASATQSLARRVSRTSRFDAVLSARGLVVQKQKRKRHGAGSLRHDVGAVFRLSSRV